MPGPLVSVILPCYKMGQFISEALVSIGGQTYDDWEVIAVDDHGPEDGTREAVEAFSALHPKRRIEFIRLPENRGVSAARNAGAAVANGAYLAFLDPDDIWHENHLQCHLSEHGSERDMIVSTSRAGCFSSNDSKVITGDWGYSKWECSIFPLALALRNVIIPSTVIIPATRFREVGGFDENRALQHTEDWDLWIRLVDSGMKFCFIDEQTVLYRRHHGGSTSDRRLMRERVQVFSDKHHSRLFPDLALATWELSKRVDALEARLNYLQKNPLIRALSLFQRVIGSRKV